MIGYSGFGTARSRKEVRDMCKHHRVFFGDPSKEGAPSSDEEEIVPVEEQQEGAVDSQEDPVIEIHWPDPEESPEPLSPQDAPSTWDI